MKHTLPFLFSLVVAVASAQNPPLVVVTKDGIAPIIVTLDSLTAQQIYAKSLKWVQETYKNPDKVLAANIPNEKIRINGFQPNAYRYGPMKTGVDMEYTFEVDFKDKKMRISVSADKFSYNGQPSTPYSSFWKDNGEVRGAYKYTKGDLEATFNSLVASLYGYINKKAEDW